MICSETLIPNRLVSISEPGLVYMKHIKKWISRGTFRIGATIIHRAFRQRTKAHRYTICAWYPKAS